MIKNLILFFFLIYISFLPISNSEDKINFWNITRKGANIFNKSISEEDIKAAKKYGVEFIRLAPDKFTAISRDFLIGDADNYTKIVKEDLEKLKEILDICDKEQIKVVITMLSLPGSRWRQNNQGQDDLRIWQEEKFRKQAADFWKNLTMELKDHPTIIGYNILNEPHPEKIFSQKIADIDQENQLKIQKTIHDFYELIIDNIRLSDKDTPIILDSSSYADPKIFGLLQPQKDENIIYSFHMFEPYQYTNYKVNKGRFSYPGNVSGKMWNKEELKNYMSLVTSFQEKYNIPSNRILVGEFGGHRMSAGLDKYFQDLIDIFTEFKWHFAFYAFREDNWNGMDYELGDKKLPWEYWQAIKRGEKPELDRQSDYPAFSVIKNSLTK